MRLQQALIKAEQGYAIRKKEWAKGLYVFMSLEDGYLHWGHNEMMYCEGFELLDSDWELF
jgi:hypothetical protein